MEVHGHVAVLTLDAGSRRNALRIAMADELVEACGWLDEQRHIGAVVVRGADGTFCAGADRALLSEASEDPAEDGRFRSIGTIYSAIQAVGAIPVPTVAAVRGAAIGAGLNLALVTDLRIVSRDARLMSGFLQAGLHPGGGHASLLSRLAGPETAAGLAAFGLPIDGARAERLGLAWEAVDDADVESRAVEIATAAAADPELSRAVIASLRATASRVLPIDLAIHAERGAQMWSLRRRRRDSRD